jgi:hypothetical protein
MSMTNSRLEAMHRREFISDSVLATAGWLAAGRLKISSGALPVMDSVKSDGSLYALFSDPPMIYRPFVRWWWNGDKVEKAELIRELRLLREAGLGGVEINPIQFPSRSEGDDLGIPSLEWLGDEWITMLQVVFDEARTLNMSCDLIVGSGWPYGSENMPPEERSQIVVISVKKLIGPIDFSISKEEIFNEADPAVSSPWPGRAFELLSLMLVPDPVMGSDQIKNLSDLTGEDYIDLFIPEGNHALYALVRVTGFMEVINGAPGAGGPVIDHFNKAAVDRYLRHMSETIQAKTGPLSYHLRSLFTDSMELEGANWTGDMQYEFMQKRGYDILPYLPFVLFRTGAMGNVIDVKYGAMTGTGFEDMISRMRYDFETTKAGMLHDRFLMTFTSWCSEMGVKSRMQAYGRGFYPLESSFAVDIPECESWTMNWLKHRIGEEMPDSDYRRGRAYTMVNKYVSSAAHLSGKRIVSCEEMTDTYTVFNTSLENLKIGSDQSIISGVNHSIFHGFNYSPPEAPYPGWIRYGGYFNEKNNWWPYFHFLNEYKGRLSSLLQNTVMFADIAILTPIADMWSVIGMQNEPFPSKEYIEYLSLVWEAIVKNGSGCDYVSERVLQESKAERGWLHYGPRRYNTLFLVHVESIDPVTANKMLEFVQVGGRIFCVETCPAKSPGWIDHEARDREVIETVSKLRTFPDRFIILKKPENDFITWYKTVQEQFMITPYLHIECSGPFLMQARFRADDASEYIFIINSHIHNSHKTRVVFSKDITRNKNTWIWDPESGNRFRVNLSAGNSIGLDLGPAESLLFVFDRERKGPAWRPLTVSGINEGEITGVWSVELRHCHDGSVSELMMDKLSDLKDIPALAHFSGTVIYRNIIRCKESQGLMLNLGKVYGTTELKVNGRSCGVRWYGRRIFSIGEYVIRGNNSIEITVTTSMGNYMKSLIDNPIAQYWTNAGNKIQPLQSMGMIGPVRYYNS